MGRDDLMGCQPPSRAPPRRVACFCLHFVFKDVGLRFPDQLSLSSWPGLKYAERQTMAGHGVRSPQLKARAHEA